MADSFVFQINWTTVCHRDRVGGVTCRRYCLRETGPQIAQCPPAASCRPGRSATGSADALGAGGPSPAEAVTPSLWSREPGRRSAAKLLTKDEARRISSEHCASLKQNNPIFVVSVSARTKSPIINSRHRISAGSTISVRPGLTATRLATMRTGIAGAGIFGGGMGQLGMGVGRMGRAGVLAVRFW